MVILYMSEGFYVFLVATTSGIIGIVLKLCYDSKCETIECCCIKIKRDIGKELEEDKYKIDHNIPTSNFQIPMKKETYDDAV